MYEVDAKAAADSMTHLDIKSLGNRLIPGLPVLLNDDYSKWGIWVPANEPGKLVRLKAPDLTEGTYFAKQDMELANDVYFHFVHVAVQHLGWQDTARASEALRIDTLNLAATLKTMEILHKAGQAGENVRRPAQVQLEYIILACRSMFDLAQEILRAYYCRLQWKDPEWQARKQGTNLPASFAKMCVQGHERPRTKQEIEELYPGLSPPWVKFYLDQTDFLFALRQLRDDIAHKGTEVPWIYHGDRGFYLAADDRAVKQLYSFPNEHLVPGNPNRLGSLLSLVGYVIHKTIKMLEAAADLIEGTGTLPAIAPKYKVFMRDPHLHLLTEGELPVTPTDNPWYATAEKPTGTGSGK